MATKTSNLNLTKPAQGDAYDVDDFNSNFKIIDDYAGTTQTNLKIMNNNINNHRHNLSDSEITGILPVEKGGTGATTASNAIKNLGLDGLVKTCYVVASSDSDEELKKYADYICDIKDMSQDGNKIANIINKVPNNSTIHFLAGTYTINSVILVINKPIALIGAENGSTEFIYTNGGTVNIGNGTELNNVYIKNIALKSERSVGYIGAGLLHIDNVNKIRLENLTLEETIPSQAADVNTPTTITITNSAKNMIMTGCRIKTNYSNYYDRYYTIDVRGNTVNSIIIGSTLVGNDGFMFNIQSKGTTIYEQFGNLEFHLCVDGVKQNKEIE